jgi:hypothetical protein
VGGKIWSDYVVVEGDAHWEEPVAVAVVVGNFEPAMGNIESEILSIVEYEKL